MSKRVYIKTFGCQMNEHDSEKIAGVLGAEDYLLTDSPEGADLVILNTCAIREKAEQKCFSDLGRLRRLKAENPDLRIGVAGCVAQQEGERILERAPYVDLVFGTDNIHEVPELLRKREERGRGVIQTQRHRRREGTTAVRQHPVKGWVTVVDGCDRFCTFCVVPHTRGRERSRKAEEVRGEVANLADRGYREITLLGQNVNAYGKDLPGETDLAGLLGLLHDLPGIVRYRFVTSHPSALDSRLIQAMAELPKVCEALHLPVQSGSNPVLSTMRRDYTRQIYVEKIALLRKWIPGIALSTDIIVGFPGESDKDFKETMSLLEEVRFDAAFAFKYSRRPYTPAAEMENQISEEVKEDRLREVLAVQDAITLNKNQSHIGEIEEILIEGIDRKGLGRMTGRTRGNKIVHLEGGGEGECLGRIIPARIVRATDTSLRGEVAH